MKTNFEKVDGRWVVATGEVVAVDYFNMGDDCDIVLADQYKDVCTGKTYAKQRDDFASEIVGEPIWHLVKHYGIMPEYKHVRSNNKKAARAARMADICGIHYGKQGKRIGKNRAMSRIMYPSADVLAEFENELPF